MRHNACRQEHKQLTAENLPEFMSYLEECVQNTVVLELPNDHASTCPTEGEFSKVRALAPPADPMASEGGVAAAAQVAWCGAQIKDVKSYMQFFVRDNQAYARAYSDIGDGEAVTIVKGKRQATEVRRALFSIMIKTSHHACLLVPRICESPPHPTARA